MQTQSGKTMQKYLLRFLFIIFTFVNITFAYGDTVSIDWIVDDTTHAQTTCEMGDDLILPTAPTKPGYTFRGWKIASYTPVEYLQGTTNAQYIDTGIIPNSSMKIYGKFGYQEPINNGNSSFFGARSAQALETNGVYFWTTSTQLKTQWFGQRINIDNTRQPGDIYEYSIENSSVSITKNGSLFTQYVFLPSGTTEYPLFINAVNNSGNTDSSRSVSRIYRFTIDNVIDLIPVIDENGVPCMYDKIQGNFYYNVGTGSFIAGPEI